jgi:YbgC/YbaW family acyl-CoA thioester hydrolase
MVTKTEWIVSERDIDELGHVNNSVYVSYLEVGRSHWYSEAGISFKEMRRRNVGTVVVRLDIQYRKEATIGERLWIETWPVSMGNTSFIMEQKITNELGEIVTEATVTSVMFNRSNRKSMTVLEEIASRF